MHIALQKWFFLMLAIFFSVGFFIFAVPPVFAADPCEEYSATQKTYNEMSDAEQKALPGLSMGEKLKNLDVQCAMQNEAKKQNAGTKTGAQKLINPLDPEDKGLTVNQFIGQLIKFAFGLAGSAALLMFVWGGLQYILSAGNDDKIKKGKETIKYAAFGLIIMFVSYTLINALIVALQSGTVT